MESRFCSSQIAGSRTVGTSLPNHVPIKKSPLYQTEYGVRVGRHVWEVQVCLYLPRNLVLQHSALSRIMLV
jgi:hypothetical protein